MTTTDTGAGLYRAIVEDPANVEPRLVLADFLDEHGEGDRAEFIRCQVELADLISCPTSAAGLSEPFSSIFCRIGEGCRRCALRRRADDLLFARSADGRNSNWWHWAPPVLRDLASESEDGPLTLKDDGGDLDWTFRRGMVEQVTLTLASFMGGVCQVCEGEGGEYHYPRDDPTNRRLEGDQWYHCRACWGKGRTPGLAAALALAVPLHPRDGVRLSDREPQHYHNNPNLSGHEGPLFGWHRGPMAYSGRGEIDEPHCLPVALWDVVSVAPGCNVHGPWADFRSEPDALSALARAAVLHARTLAKLETPS